MQETHEFYTHLQEAYLQLWDRQMIQYYRDPVLKIVSTRPVVCPHGHINDHRIVQLGAQIEGYARCNHFHCRTRMPTYDIDDWHAGYVRMWYAQRGHRFGLRTYSDLCSEADRLVNSIRSQWQLRTAELPNNRPLNFVSIFVFVLLAYAIGGNILTQT